MDLPRVSWDVRDPVDLAEIWEGPGQSRPLTAEEWEFKPHPSSSWIVLMKFDGRAIDSDDWSNGPEIRREVFSKDATLRDLLERITEGPRYGYFEGLAPMESGLDTILQTADAWLVKQAPKIKKKERVKARGKTPADKLQNIFDDMAYAHEMQLKSCASTMDAAMWWIRKDVDALRWALSDTYRLQYGT
jgi:hypothetical protein